MEMYMIDDNLVITNGNRDVVYTEQYVLLKEDGITQAMGRLAPIEIYEWLNVIHN